MTITTTWPAERIRRLEDLQERAGRLGYKVTPRRAGRGSGGLYAFTVASFDGTRRTTVFGFDAVADFLANLGAAQ